MNPTTTHVTQPSGWKIGLVLFGIGFIGVLSLLLTDLVSMQALPKAVTQRFTPLELKLLMLVNPTLFLAIAVSIGARLYAKTGLQILSSTAFLPDGVLPGLLAGLADVGIALIFKQLIPREFKQLNQATEFNVLTRFLYGGVTEELMLRFGLMTFVVWAIISLSGQRVAWVYWLAICIAAFLFGAGHLPALHTLVKHPSSWLTLYILLGNSVAGLVFGWVYWRKGLAMAMVAHASAHLVLLAGDLL